MSGDVSGPGSGSSTPQPPAISGRERTELPVLGVGMVRERTELPVLGVGVVRERTELPVLGVGVVRERAELPVLGVGVVRERADAARNRLRVLAAAERLFADRGVSGVTMDDIAAAAGVGKGTLYRRFTDKGGLAVALLDERERELQEQILRGPPPLGPGAAPTARLAAFVAGYLAFLDRQLDLVLLSETATPGARLRTGAHAFWRQHCRYLLSEGEAPDPDLRAQLLLAGLAADQVRHWLRDEARDRDDLARALVAAALALAGGLR